MRLPGTCNGFLRIHTLTLNNISLNKTPPCMFKLRRQHIILCCNSSLTINSILWQTHQQQNPIFFWLLDLSIWMTFFVTPQICQLLPTVNLCVIFGVDLSHSHCPKPSFQCNISSMWPPVQTLQISLQCVWLTLALLSLIPSSPILHHLSPQYIVNFIHFYLIGILNCLKLCIHLHFHRAPFLLSSLYIHIPR